MAELPMGWSERTASCRQPPSHAAMNTSWSGSGKIAQRKSVSVRGQGIRKTEMPGSTGISSITTPAKPANVDGGTSSPGRRKLGEIEAKLSVIALSLANLTNKMQVMFVENKSPGSEKAKDRGTVLYVRDAQCFVAGALTMAVGIALYSATRWK